MVSKSFAESEDVLEKLADEAVAEKREGKTPPLDLTRLTEANQAAANRRPDMDVDEFMAGGQQNSK